MGNSGRGLTIGVATSGGMSGVDSNWVEKSCKSWKAREPRATPAVSKTGSNGYHAAWCLSMRGWFAGWSLSRATCKASSTRIP